jgi:UDP-N-acetylglucosamine 1-carboxyvinyltransferase
MFESRLFFVDKLIDMGAKIMLCDPHRAVVMGHDFLTIESDNDVFQIFVRVSLIDCSAFKAKGTKRILSKLIVVMKELTND